MRDKMCDFDKELLFFKNIVKKDYDRIDWYIKTRERANDQPKLF